MRVISKKDIIIVIFVVIILTVAEFVVMKLVKSSNNELYALEHDAMTADLSLKSKTNLVLRYKHALSFDSRLIPNEEASPSAFYTLLVKTLNSSGLYSPNVEKVSSGENILSFKISGSGQYFNLISAIASLRQNTKLNRLNAISLKGGKDGSVDYIFIIQAYISPETYRRKTGVDT